MVTFSPQIFSRLDGSVRADTEWTDHSVASFIMIEGSSWHTAEDTWSSSVETNMDLGISSAHDNGFLIAIRWMNGADAPTWPTYGTEYDLILRQDDTPGTVPAYDDPEYHRVYQQGLDHLVEWLQGDCPETATHTRAEHVHSLVVSMVTEQGSEMGAQVGTAATYSGSATLTSTIDASQTTLGLSGTLTSYPTTQALLRIDNGGTVEYVQQASRSGGSVTLESDGRGWCKSTAAGHNSGVTVNYASANTFGDFVLDGKTTNGKWDEAVTNDNEWTDQIGNDAARRALMKTEWLRSIRWTANALGDVVRSDGTPVRTSVAVGGMFSDSLVTAQEIVEEAAREIGHKLVVLTTNLQADYVDGTNGNDDNYEELNVDEFDTMKLAKDEGIYMGFQTGGTGKMPDNITGLRDMIRCVEDVMGVGEAGQGFPAMFIETQHARFHTTTSDTAATYGGYTTESNDNFKKYLLNATGGDDVDARIADEYFRDEDWSGDGTSPSDEDNISNANSSITTDINAGSSTLKFDNALTNPEGSTFAARIDATTNEDCYIRYDSLGDLRYIYISVYWRMDTTLSDNMRFIRLKDSSNTVVGGARFRSNGAIELGHQTSFLGSGYYTTTFTVGADDWHRIEFICDFDEGGMLVRGYDTEESVTIVEEESSFGHATALGGNGIDRVEIGRVGWGGSETIKWWLGNLSVSNHGWRKPDNTAPSAWIFSHSHNETVSGTIELRSHIYDMFDTSANLDGEISIDGGGYVNMTWDSGNNWWDYSWNTTLETDGNIDVIIRGTDPAGNVGVSETYTFDVDNGGTLTTQQEQYRWGDVNAGETTYNFLAALNTALEVSDTTDQKLALRVAIGAAGAAAGSTTDWHLQARINTGTWYNVNSSNGANCGVIAESDADFTDQGATTERLSAGGTFEAGKVSDNTANTQIDDVGITDGNNTELVWIIETVNTAISDGDDINFRLRVDTGTGFDVLDTITVTPQLNVVADTGNDFDGIWNMLPIG